MKMPKQDRRWPDAHVALKRLYAERVPAGMTQEEFGAEFGIGTQGMVWQYLNGHRPLNVEAAAKFARGLRCTIQDISPEMASALQRDLLPVLGTKILRAALSKAVLVLVLVIPPFLPSPARAAQFDITINHVLIACRRLRAAVRRVFMTCANFGHSAKRHLDFGR